MESVSDSYAIYSWLTNSMSSDENVRKPAELALSQFEIRPGFCSCLMEVITSADLASQVDVRLVASVYLKNCINRFWRNERDSAVISGDEKNHLRQKLLSHLREEHDKIAVMLAVLISEIACFDFPEEWQDLFSFLAHKLQSADVLSSYRIFFILFRTLKELSNKRLTSDQRNFAEITYQLTNYCGLSWKNDVQTILRGFSTLAQSYNTNSLEQDLKELYLICERWLLCSKIICQLIISGFPSDPNRRMQVQPLKEVAPVFLTAIQSLLPYYSTFLKRNTKFGDFIRKMCTKLMKVLVILQRAHSYSFGDKSVLPPLMDFCLNKITDPEPHLLSFEPFLIQCMVVVKLALEEYKPSLTARVMDVNGITLEQIKRNTSNDVGGTLNSLLPSERIVLLCNVLIRRYLVLSASDLEELYQNPESSYHDQDMIHWSENLRPCAEALYIILFHNHSQLLGPVVVSILQEAINACPASVTEITAGLLLKDAVYGAAAYVHYELSNYLSFKDWFNGTLSLELSNDHPNMRIIHRKVALILGQWVSQIKDDTKRPVYSGLIRLLQCKDLYVRLDACQSLCLHIEDANFLEREFTDLLPICYDLCFKLMEEVQECDSKFLVLNLISVIGYAHDVTPYANKFVQFFKKSWEESSGESFLQIELLTSLRSFVTALGCQSPSCYNVLLPILQSGLDINGPGESNLLEDSILLWDTTISYAPAMVPQLLACFPYLVEIMEIRFEHLQVAVNIMEGYIILGGTEFLNMHASSVAKILDLIVENADDKGLLSALPIIDILIQCFPMEVPPLISSTLQKLVVICLSGKDDIETVVKASTAAILARTLVMNTTYIAQLTAEPSLVLLLQQSGTPLKENVLLSLVDVWLDKIDYVSSTQRKTFGLALSIILTLRLPQVLDKLDQILSVCTSVILDELDNPPEDDCRSHGETAAASDESRRRQINLSDPIKQLSLENSVEDNLQTCAALHGESFYSAISRMHPAVFAQLKQVLKMQ